MGETVEKIYCRGHDNNDNNTLAAAILANGNNRRDDWGLDGRHDGWRYEPASVNNPFAYPHVPGSVPLEL